MAMRGSGCRLALAGLFCALLLPVTGCQRGENTGPKRIIIMTNGADPYWDACAAGARDAAKEFGLEEAGYRVVVERNDFTVQGQVDKLKQYANATDVAAVGISVFDVNSVATADAMRALQKQGVKVITIDSDVDQQRARDARFAYLGTYNVLAGQELGKAVRGLRPEGGTYATFVGNKGAANAKERIAGFAEGAGEAFQQVESLGDGADKSVARTNVRDALDRHPDLDVLVGIWAYNGPACVATLEDLKLPEPPLVVTFDAAPQSIDYMNKGKIEAMLVQNPYEMGYLGVKLMKALVTDDQTVVNEMFPRLKDEGGDIYITGLKVVVPDVNSPLTAAMFDDGTEFLTLDEFYAWLQQYGLTGS